MHLEGDAIVLDAKDVEGFLREMYTEISGFLADGPTRLVIPLEGVTVLGLSVVSMENDPKA